MTLQNKPLRTALLLASASLFLQSASPLQAQLKQPTTATLTTVPRLVRVSSSFHPANGSAPSATESATLAIYASETGGTPLWQETQNISVDSGGHYTVLLGSTRNEGLPLELFASGDPRWLAVEFQRPGEAEQPRLLLASVPYALKAADSETLGGRPPSSYVLAEPVATSIDGTPPKAGVTGTKAALPRVTGGTPNTIAKFVNATDLGNSVMFENSGKVGLGTLNPLDFFHVAFNDTTGTVTGYAVQNLGSGAGAFSGMLFYDQSGALAHFQGFNNSTHEYRVNNVATSPAGTINFLLGGASKLLLRSDGDLDVPGSIRKGTTLFLHNLGTNNTGLGLNALTSDTSGFNNTSLGFGALALNTAGSNNSATGAFALEANVIGSNNTASGAGALEKNTAGNNTAVGEIALINNTSGPDNTATGANALMSNTTGASNTATGESALLSNSTGSNNTALGRNAGMNLTTGSNNIIIGNNGVAADDHVIRMGDVQTNTFIAGIFNATVPNGVPVLIDSNGHLGTIPSSRRYKEDIQDMAQASSGLLRLRPVTYRYKKASTDGSKPLDYGLIAEEVAEVYPDLVARGKDGQIETVQYQKLTPMLLNELQKQNLQIRQQSETIALQQEHNRKLEARLAALESLLQGRPPSHPR